MTEDEAGVDRYTEEDFVARVDPERGETALRDERVLLSLFRIAPSETAAEMKEFSALLRAAAEPEQ